MTTINNFFIKLLTIILGLGAEAVDKNANDIPYKIINRTNRRKKN